MYADVCVKVLRVAPHSIQPSLEQSQASIIGEPFAMPYGMVVDQLVLDGWPNMVVYQERSCTNNNGFSKLDYCRVQNRAIMSHSRAKVVGWEIAMFVACCSTL